MSDRYTRQRRLAEVGDRGQARIAAAHYSVGASAEGWIEREYLERAGAGAVTSVAALEVAPFAHAGTFRHRASLRIAAGSWRALVALRRTLSEAT
jgi:hypothetical protein